MTNPTEMAEIAATLAVLTAEVQALRSEVKELRRAKAKTSELMDEIGPIGLEVMAAATETFADLEERGYFRFGKELLGVVDHVVQGYTAEDVKELGENVVTILDTVKAVTQPQAMAFAQQAGAAIERGEGGEPVSVWEMMKASKDQDVQHGMAVVLSVIKQIGRTARTETPAMRGAPTHPKYAKLAGRLASSRPRKERLALPPGQKVSVNMPKPSPSAVNIEAMKRPELPAPFNQLPHDENGHLLNADDWTPEYADAVAAQEGIALTDAHMAVLLWVRGAFADTTKCPNVRAISTGSGLGTKGVYELFPKKPGTTIARIAGVPKPVGCI